jgi:hypothetical protein
MLTCERIIAKDIRTPERFSYFQRQLSNLLVHYVEGISLKSFVKDSKGRIEGNTGNGSAIIQDLPHGLQIYLRRRDNLGTISPVFLSKMKEFLCLNEQSYSLLQRVVMCDDDELICEDLEKHGVSKFEQQLQDSVSDTIAGSDEDSDESLTESGSNTSPIGPSHRPEAPIPRQTKVRPPDDKLGIGAIEPNRPSTPVRPRRHDDQKLSNASPLNSSRFRSPTPGRPIFEVFQHGSIVDTTPLVTRNNIAQTPGSHATELSIPRLPGGTTASAFYTGSLLDAVKSIPLTQSPAASQSQSPSASPSPRPRPHRGRRSMEPPARDEESPIAAALEQDIGFYGELFVFQHLKRLLGPSINYETWTSAYRNRAFSDPRMIQAEEKAGEKYKEFVPNEQKKNSDFTYTDDDGRLSQYLSQRGRRLPRWKDGSGKEWPLTFHLEVKSTPGRLDERFYLSNNQLDLAKQWSLRNSPLLHVYVILRVYDLDYKNTLTAKVMYYIDPWSMICDGTLHLQTSNVFQLTPSRTASAIRFQRLDSQE